jgi:hypothetical protein
MLSVGYAAEIASLEGEVLARETVIRSRRTINELFFAGSWGKSIV